MCRLVFLVFLSWLEFVQCLCISFLFYLTVLIACMICFYYNVCDCHAFIKGNLLTYLLLCKLLWLEPYCSTLEVHQISSKAGSGINILYLLTSSIDHTKLLKVIHKRPKDCHEINRQTLIMFRSAETYVYYAQGQCWSPLADSIISTAHILFCKAQIPRQQFPRNFPVTPLTCWRQIYNSSQLPRNKSLTFQQLPRKNYYGKVTEKLLS